MQLSSALKWEVLQKLRAKSAADQPAFLGVCESQHSDFQGLYAAL